MSSQAPKQIKPIVAANILAAREAKGMRQRDIAEVIDTDAMSISRWERGKVMPTLENLLKIAAATDRDISWFYMDHEHRAAA